MVPPLQSWKLTIGGFWTRGPLGEGKRSILEEGPLWREVHFEVHFGGRVLVTCRVLGGKLKKSELGVGN